jgi:hypothetical protein
MDSDCIRTTKLKQLERQLGIPTSRRPSAPEVVRQMVIDEVDKDVTQNNGPNYVKVKLRSKGVVVARCVRVCEFQRCQLIICLRQVIRDIMRAHFPLGFDQRFPGRNKQSMIRRPLTAIGPFHEISCDGHEKLSKQALQMGDIGLPIYGYKDKWSDVILKVTVVPNCRSPGAIGHLYLDFVEETGGTCFDVYKQD